MDYKALYEKELRAKEAYKKVNKKQSDKIKELKKEIAEKEQLNQEKKEFYENLADKAKEATSIIKNQKHQIHQLEATIETIKCLKEQVDASLKEENEKLKKERWTDEQIEKKIEEVFDEYELEDNYLSQEDEFNLESWLNDVSEHIQEEIKFYKYGFAELCEEYEGDGEWSFEEVKYWIDKQNEEIEELKKENKEQKEKIDTMNEQMNKIVDLDSLVGTEAECDIQNIFNDEEDED